MSNASLHVVVATELRAWLHDGGVWVPRAFAHDYWSTFLGVPTSTVLIMRAEPVVAVSAELAPLEGPMVRAILLPPLRLGTSLLSDVPHALRRLWALNEPGAVILRMPGVVGTLLLLVTILRRRRFGVQMVGDALDVAFKAGIGGRPGRIAGVVLAGSAALACRRASAVSYVTDRYLQERYPPRRRVPARAIANVVLDKSQMGHQQTCLGETVRIVTVGSLEQVYKRVDLLLESTAILVAQGWAVEVHVAGGGRLLDGYRRQVAELGLTEVVTFHGMLDHSQVLALVASADLFVLCSDTEGMPRAMIEAMAAGTPCVGSAVGGILELLPAYALFEPGSVNSLVGALGRHLNSVRLRIRSSADMLDRAGDFHPDRLKPLRAEFVEDLRSQVAVKSRPARRRCS